MTAWLFGGPLSALLVLMLPIWIAGHIHREKTRIHSADRNAPRRESGAGGMPVGALRAVFLGWTLLIAVFVIWAFTGAEGEPGVALGVVLVFASAVPGALAAVLTNYLFTVARSRA